MIRLVRAFQNSGHLPVANRSVCRSVRRAAAGRNVDPWTEVRDPNGSRQTYWWNKVTNQTTALGAPHPESVNADDPWCEIQDPHGSGKTYWWNRVTNQTTVVGAARPRHPPELFDKLRDFKDDVARHIHARRRGRIIVFGDGGYHGAGSFGDGGGGTGAG
eukprot:TRINITY_DN45202_c0_g1_i1.p1 TRINITY_DN45202_c0_g1~~TRINITY_DN45202_c0_g1_i1.p1  ORF type:complete len:160 (+),score=14.54 TRINITY_DN45202_c0_g1_i1:82-561(+)